MPERDDAYRRDMRLAALVHDMGKLLTLFGEDDGNVDCMNSEAARRRAATCLRRARVARRDPP
eukprot:6099734-Prymnesium_polylepis.1